MSEATKEELFKIYEEVYALTAEAELPCWTSCQGLCEEKENAYFLPWEEEYIARRLGLGPEAFPEVTERDGPVNAMVSITPQGLVPRHCPFDLLDKGIHHCTIHEVRPLDCRSFPVFPVFDPDHPASGMRFYVADYCPIHQRLPDKFVQLITQAWARLAPHLPAWWWQGYNQDLPERMTELKPGS